MAQSIYPAVTRPTIPISPPPPSTFLSSSPTPFLPPPSFCISMSIPLSHSPFLLLHLCFLPSPSFFIALYLPHSVSAPSLLVQLSSSHTISPPPSFYISPHLPPSSTPLSLPLCFCSRFTPLPFSPLPFYIDILLFSFSSIVFPISLFPSFPSSLFLSLSTCSPSFGARSS